MGYDHVGYNIGGIVGRQSGYLDGCANSGDILGRKDVGGVAGQLEPEVRLLYDQGQMGELLDALDGLGDLLDQTQQDLRGTSDALSDRMDAISARTDEAREAVGDLGGLRRGLDQGEYRGAQQPHGPDLLAHRPAGADSG